MSDLNLDWNREKRQRLPEIVYGEGKSVEQLRRILDAFADKGKPVFVTRLQEEKVAELEVELGSYDSVGRTLWVPDGKGMPAREGSVALVFAGTSDLPVVNEAERVLAYLGISSKAYGDVGVAGIHRIHEVIEAISGHDVVMVFAGFEGALASVVAGLIGKPIIGVPTSVGYGVTAKGEVALKSMLGSCANGLLTVNIDNGTGAALAAARILGI